MKIAIGSDHAAFELKQTIKQHLEALGYEHEDFGAFTGTEPANDYHLIGAKVAHAIVEEKFDYGIIMCGTGMGMSIAANKVPGAWAALCDNLFIAKKSREHNNANVLVLGARVIGDELAKEIVTTWLNTEYAGGRHDPRNANLAVIEKTYRPRD